MITKNLTPIINTIENVIATVPGWTPLDQLYTLFDLILFNPHLEGDIVEIGSWCGRSAIVLGLAEKMIGGKAKLNCIDLFPNKNDWFKNDQGTYSFKVELNGQTNNGYCDQTVDEEPYLRDIATVYAKNENLLDYFRSNIQRFLIDDICNIHRCNSEIFFRQQTSNFKCKIAFIDGDHSYKGVCQDIKNVDKYLVKGGWICFDDAFSSYYPGIDQAIKDLIISNPDYELAQQMTRKFFIARKRV